MAKLAYAEAFIEDMQSVELKSKRDEIFDRIDLLADFPGLGSSNLPASVVTRFGGNVRKLVVDPFDVIYEHDAQSDTVNILGLIHQRAAK